MPHQPGRHAAVSPRELRRQAARRDAEFTEDAIAERASALKSVAVRSGTRPQRPGPATRSTRKLGRPLAILGVMAISTGLMVSVSLPAAAATVDPDAATGGAIPSAATMASVSYEVAPGTASPQIQRDAYTATSQSDVDAANAAAAAAASAAAESASSSSSGGSTASSATFAAPAVARSGAAILAYASEFVGVVPYGNGNDPSDSFSCDGYVQYVFKAFGVNLPRGAGAQARTGVQISASEAVAGDLLYWPEGHIGIYDGNGGMYDSPDWGRMVQHRLSIWGDPEYIRIP
ncbi:C40 family peptidase [Plantibacter sp. Mn2098]|uniref:C40 family peptidase n=1 Tax=Plantibacter sp. Mn2098 TaxID=3395266 RepID=UPI003BD894B3